MIMFRMGFLADATNLYESVRGGRGGLGFGLLWVGLGLFWKGMGGFEAVFSGLKWFLSDFSVGVLLS